MNLSKIRSVFPDWPSELDAAKVPGHWASKAQSFFCAATVLGEENRLAQGRFERTVGKPVDPNDMRRMQTTVPAEFCLAFSLELAIKSILVAQGKLDELSSGQTLPFANHQLHELAEKVEGLEVTAEEKKTLLWASETILNGRYPVPKKPNDTKNGVPLCVAFSDTHSKVEPLYKRLIGMVTAYTAESS